MNDNEEKSSNFGEEAKKAIEFDAQDIKNETKEAYNQVKDTFKNVDFKEEAKSAQNFVLEIFTDPFAAIKDAATGRADAFSKSIVLMVIWIVLNGFSAILGLFKYGFRFMTLIRAILDPAAYICAIAVVAFLFNRDNRKSLTSIVATMVVASVPKIFGAALSVIANLVTGISIITSPFSYAFEVLSVVFAYYAFKALFDEPEDKSFIRKFTIMIVVIEFLLVILSRIGITSIIL